MSDAGSPPPRKPRRLLRRVALAVVVLLLAGIAGAVLLRQPIATRAAVAYLEAQGIPVESLTVTRLTPGALEARDIRLGTAGEVTLRRLSATPVFDGFDAAIAEAEIEGLRVSLDVTGERPLLGSLQPFAERLGAEQAEQEPAGQTAQTEAAEEAGAAAFPVRRVTVSNSSVIFATLSGPMTASLEGTLAPDSAGGLRAEASLALDSALGRIKAALDARRAADGTIRFDAELADGHLAWQTLRVERFQGRASATGIGTEHPGFTGSVDLSGLSHTPEDGPALQLSQGRIEAAFDPASALLTAALQGDGERLDLNASAAITGGDEGTPRLVLALGGEAESAGGLARLIALPGPAVSRGTLVFQAGSTSVLGPVGPSDSKDTLLTILRDPAEKLLGNALTLSGEAIAADVALADGTEGISGHLPLAVQLSADQAVLTLTQDAALRVERPSGDSLSAIGVPGDLLPLVASGLNLTLKSGGDLPFRLAAPPGWPPASAAIAVAAEASSEQGVKLGAKVEGSAAFGDALAVDGFDGSIVARAEAKSLSLGGREARGVTATLPLTAAYGAEGLRLALAAPGSLAITQFGKGAPLRLGAPLAFAVDSLTLDTAPATGGYRYSLEGRGDGATLALGAADGAAIDVTAGTLSFAVTGRFEPQAGHDATLTTRLAGLALPGYDFTAEAAEIDIGLDRELRPATSRFALGPFQVGGEPAATAPLRLNGTLKRKGAGYDLAGEVALAGGAPLAALAGRYGDDGRARIRVDGAALTFSPDGLQPADISPMLADLTEVGGRLEADAELVWPRDPAGERATLRLSGLSFGGPAKVDGLDLDLTLDRLLPPASPPGQRLTIASLEAGLPVEDISVTFALDPKPALAVAGGGFDLGGARWRIEPATLDPAAAGNRVVLATDGLDLATLFTLLGVDGLSGSGTLSGSVPVVFSGGDVVIEESRFEAQGPGVLSIRIDALRSALAGSGEAVEAAVKALEDFRYDNLTVTLAKSAANDATVRLSTLGSNPDVMDGQPFQFNINLESNLTSVLEALRQGYSLSDDALRRAWKLQE